MHNLANLMEKYDQLLSSQYFIETDLDYSAFDRQVPFLDQMATLKNSGITVFDLHRRKHIYSSYNLEEIFGYDYQKVRSIGNDYFNSRIHPDDFYALTFRSVGVMELVLGMPVNERRNYKLLNEYRILNQYDQYIRIIEQHSLLELDKHGNCWLSLGIIDISPNQEPFPGVKSQLVNIRNGAICDYSQPVATATNPGVSLTKRETEILQKVKEGMLSKEISDELSLSVHTVNTHRQNILKKLGVGNSMEAVEFASKLGLV
ncbi:MAG: LuxR C-terminal-related transcriptional regulator [Breznakibacter sp.]